MSRYGTGRSQLYRDILQRLQGLPSVEAAAIAEFGPLSHSEAMTNLSAEGYASRNDEDSGGADINAVGAGYFRSLGTPLISGREFSASDHAGTPKVAIINQAFAKHLLPARNPLASTCKSARAPLISKL